MENKKKGFSVLYLIIIISIILSLGVIVLNKQKFFNLMVEQTQIKNLLIKNTISKYSLSTNKHLFNNQDGGGYTPTISCPTNVSYISGGVPQGNGSTQLKFDENLSEYTCSGLLMGNILNLYYTGGYLLFSSGSIGSEKFSISKISNDYIGTLTSGNTIKFTNTLSSNIDGNRNSDDYKVTSTGSIYYPDGLADNDVESRIELFGYIPKSEDYFNIFWSNTKVNNFINSNTNNNDNLFKNISQTYSGAIYMDVDDDVELKIVEFDKNLYDTKSYLKILNQINIKKSGGVLSGFLQKDYSFSTEQNSNTLFFDFGSKDYGVFIKTGTGVISDYINYDFKIYDENGNLVYISPIKDDGDIIEYFGYDIIEHNGQYIPYLTKFFRSK